MLPAPSDPDLVLAELRGGVLVLTLNRPDQLNAWTDDLEDQYFALLRTADDDPEVRAIVVTGAGRGFCAGADMDDLEKVGEFERGVPPARPLPRTFPMTIRKPMVAALNGAAAGLGLVEALYCDVRFATPTTKLLTAFARRGLTAEYGIAWLLPRLIGQSKALDLLLSSRVVLGEEALALGLVDRVVEDGTVLDAAVAYAEELAATCSPWSISVIKAQVYAAFDTSFAQAVSDADRLMAESFAGADVAEGVQSYREQRRPAFPGLAPR